MNLKVSFLFLGCLCILSLPAFAVTTMTGNDGMGTSSLTTAGKWNDGLAPYAGNTYSSMGWLLRTPSAYGNYTFAGDSLTIGDSDAGGTQPFLTNGGVNNNSLICKTPRSGTVGPIITVNNLILNAGTVRDGQGTADNWTLAGNINVTSNGGGLANQCTLNLSATISGSGTIYMASNGSGEAARCTNIQSSSNTYNGSIVLIGATTNHARLNFVDNSLMNFTIGAAGVNNKISGTGTATYDGDYKFDLTGASTTMWDSWTISSASSQTFSGTFNVQNFVANIDGDAWTKETGPSTGVYFRFRESSGTLDVVPEPATWIMLISGAMAIALYVRRKK